MDSDVFAPQQKRTEQIGFRVTKDQKKALDEYAKREGKSISDILIDALYVYAQQVSKNSK